MSLLRTSAITACLLAGASMAGGHSNPFPEITARHGHMQLYAFNLSLLGGMAQGEIEYDAEAASAAAANLAAVANLDQSRYWTEGTDTSVEGSRALPAIWENMDDFMAKNAETAAAADALAEAAGGGLESLQAALGPFGQSCSSCHREYRQRN